MQYQIPKSDKYFWTEHSKYKMRQYSLSPQRVTRVIRNPERTEMGIVPKTVACMQRASTNKKSGEIWCMYQIRRGGNPKSEYRNPKPQVAEQGSLRGRQIQNNKIKNSKQSLLTKLKANEAKKLKIISVWRYPGVSPRNNPIPEEILAEIRSMT